MATSVDTYALVPLSTYDQIMNQKKDLSTSIETMDRSSIIQSNPYKMDVPLDVDLLIQTMPARYVKTCIVLLKHFAKLRGNFAFRPETGEIVVNKEHLVCGTNFAECLRCLLIPPKPMKTYTERQIDQEVSCGCAMITEIIACYTALPASIIAHPYWQQHLKDIRAVNQFENVIHS